MARTNNNNNNNNNTSSAHCRLYNVPEVTYGSLHHDEEAPSNTSCNKKNPLAPGPLGFASTRSVATDSPATQEHLGKHRQYWRDIILGVNDGLVSTFLLVAGVAGGGLSTTDILLTAIAGALAGAVSMCAGEYVATKSQDEVLRGEIALEQAHIQKYRSDELLELSELLSLIGIPEEALEEEEGGGKEGGGNGNHLRQQLLSHYEKNPDDLLKIMSALEFGVVEEERRSPVVAGLTSCALFFLGSLPSVIPFAIIDDPFDGLIAACIATGLALLLVGAIKTWATRGRMLEAAMENLIIAGLGGALAYGVGVGFDKLIRD